MVVAPSSSAIWTTSAVNAASERVASIGENSTSSQSALAWATDARARPLTSSRVDCSWCSMWMSEVDRNVWIRGRSLSRMASHARSMSALLARARPQMTGPWTSRAMVWTASKSPGEAIGKPASMMSTPRRASCWAISSFSAALSEMPGDCSPSRSVVSNSRTRFGSSGKMDMSLLLRSLRARVLRLFRLVRGFRRPPRAAIPPSGGGEEVGGRARGTTWTAGEPSRGRPDPLRHQARLCRRSRARR